MQITQDSFFLLVCFHNTRLSKFNRMFNPNRLGNLPFDTTKADLEKHFESAEGLMSTRLMTDKETKAPKGFAFLEFKDSECLQSALKFHHTLFKRRQINVELTAGGGGKSEARQEKLQVKREKLRTERVSADQDYDSMIRTLHI
jgi:RNA recognition motif-containing protein